MEQEKIASILEKLKQKDFLDLFFTEIEEYKSNIDFENDMDKAMFVIYFKAVVNHCFEVYDNLQEYKESLESKKTKSKEDLEKLNKVNKYIFSLELEQELKVNGTNKNKNKVKI